MVPLPDHIRLFDKERLLVAVLDEFVSYEYERRLNEATPFSVTVPLNDEAREHLEVSAYVYIYRDGGVHFVGKITGRDIGTETITISGYSEEIELERAILPAQYGLIFSGVDLSNVAEELCWDRAVLRVKDKSQWDANVDSVRVDTASEPGLVILSKTGGHYEEDGYITVRFDADQIEDFTQWERVRWASDNDAPVATSLQYRFGNTLGSMSGWTAAVEGVQTDEIGLLLAATTQRYLEVRVNLSTEDTTSDDIGYSPALYALEVIAKTRQILDTSELPLPVGESTSGLSADSETHLAVLQAACEQVGYEFSVAGGALYLAEEISTDRTGSFVLRSNLNINISGLGDTDEDLVNVLTAYGPGTGINRQRVVLEAAGSIAKYGRYPEARAFSDSIDLADLTAKATEYLTEHSELRQSYRVDAYFQAGQEPVMAIGDLVTLADPNSGIINEVRLLGLVRQVNESGSNLQLDLGTSGKSLVDAILDDLDPDRDKRLALAVPVGLRATPANPGITVSVNPYVNSRAAGVEVHMAEGALFEPSSKTLVGRGQSTSYVVTGLITGARYYFKARAYDDRGEYSEFTNEVSTLAGGVIVDDIGPIDITKFASGIRPPRVGIALPSLPDPTNYIIGDLFALYDTEGGVNLYSAIDTNDDGFADNWKPTVNAEDLQGFIAGDRIVANSLTAAQIAAGAIGATEIAADAITAGHIRAGQIGAQHIKTGGVTASHIAITDTSNMIANSTFEASEGSNNQPDGWTGPITSSNVGTDVAENYGAMGVRTSIRDAEAGQYMPVTPGQTFYMSIMARPVIPIAAGFRFGWVFANASGSFKTWRWAVSVPNSASLGWQPYEGYVTVPEGYDKGRPVVSVLNASPAYGSWNFAKAVSRIATDSRLLVDGTIDITNADKNKGALSVKTTGNTEVLRLGNIQNKAGVPVGTRYGLWGEIGTGVFIRGLARTVWGRPITSVYNGPQILQYNGRRANFYSPTVTFPDYTVQGESTVLLKATQVEASCIDNNYLLHTTTAQAGQAYGNLVMAGLGIEPQLRVNGVWRNSYLVSPRSGDVVDAARLYLTATLASTQFVVAEPSVSATHFLELVDLPYTMAQDWGWW